MIHTMIIVVALTVSPSHTVTYEVRDSFDSKKLCEQAMQNHIDSTVAQSILNGTDTYVLSASCNQNNQR